MTGSICHRLNKFIIEKMEYGKPKSHSSNLSSLLKFTSHIELKVQEFILM